MDLPADLGPIKTDLDVDGFLVGLPASLSAHRKGELTRAFTERGWKWWKMSPNEQLANTKDDESGQGRLVVRGMLSCIGMRRGMDTILQLPNHADGTPWYVSPRDGIPPHHVETHALSYAEMKPTVDKFMNDHFKDLAVASQSAGPQDMNVTLPHGANVTASDATGEGSSGSNLDPGLLRILGIGSMCYLSIMAMIKEDDISLMPADAVLEDLMDLGEFARKSSHGVQQKRKQRAQTKDAAHDGDVLTFGSSHTEAIMQGTGDYGLTYLQLLALGDFVYDFIPVERRTVLSRVLARSPVNTHILDLCSRRAKDGERTLVMVGTPWEQL